MTPVAHRTAGLMNGERTVQEIWDALCTQLGDEAPTQDEVIRLLGQLHFANALRCDAAPDVIELLGRTRRREKGERLQRWLNPLAIRVPLGDPDAFLERWVWITRPLFTPAAALLLACMGTAALLCAAPQLADLTRGAAHELLDPRNLLLLCVLYPVIKTLHELGHAFATKAFGGEVHELGVMLLALIPVPYVDASASAAFPSKHQRAAVAGAGIAVELAIGSIALAVWLWTEPGWVRTLAYNAVWIAGVSSLLVNGNPLLRYDGYYVLSDLIEIPNLGARSSEYLGSLVQRHLLGLERVRCPVQARGERRWLSSYGIGAALYRPLVTLSIALFIAERFFTMGVALAAAVVVLQVLLPLARAVGFLLRSPRVAPRRGRAVALCAGIAALLFVLPVPLRTVAEGVVWPAEGSAVRAQAGGFVVRLLAAPDARVREGQPIALLRDPALETKVAILRAELDELRARRLAQREHDPIQAELTMEEIRSRTAELERARERLGEFVVRSPRDGRLVLPGAHNLRGRLLEQGDGIGHVLGAEIRTVRAVLTQADIALVREHTEAVEVRLSRTLGERWPARIANLVPAAGMRLPSPALGSRGGGRLAVDPSDESGTRALDPVFQLDLELPAEARLSEIGGRAYVRFHHGSEPIAAIGLRLLRGLLLRRLEV
jgi:putative peptide zinc metalloprotease protein